MTVLNTLQNNQAYLEDFVTRSTYHSNALEGSNLTKNETYALTFDSNHCAINANAKEIHQAVNHKKAMLKMIERLAAGEPLTHDYLIGINEIINENILFGGAYREDPAKVSGSNKEFPSPDEIEDFLNEFINRYNEMVENGFDMKDVAEMHIHFENIHPFSDGNGRTGRLLINSMLISGHEVPIIIPLENRNDYIKMLETNNYRAMADMFTLLQENERERLQTFISLQESEE
ncbi:MAG: Fic family protein [Ileibacterium sp.]|nr:Fic family protein [Ileibacterium sp.]